MKACCRQGLADKIRMSIGQLHEKQYAEIAASEQHTAALDELREKLLGTQTELKEAKLALSRAESAHIRRLKQDASWFEGQPQGRPNTNTQAAALLDEYKEQVSFISVLSLTFNCSIFDGMGVAAVSGGCYCCL